MLQNAGRLSTCPIFVPLLCAISLAPASGQEYSAEDFFGAWTYRGSGVEFTLVLRSGGTGYLADEVEEFPFEFVLDAGRDPAHLDLTFGVDMAFGRYAETLVRLEEAPEGLLLHWVSWPTRSDRPAWPGEGQETGERPTLITFHRSPGLRQ